jgi:hypothetical protein
LVRDNLTRIRELRDQFAFVYPMVPLAAAAVLEGDDVRAARILGARDAVTERTGAKVVTSVRHSRKMPNEGPRTPWPERRSGVDVRRSEYSTPFGD